MFRLLNGLLPLNAFYLGHISAVSTDGQGQPTPISMVSFSSEGNVLAISHSIIFPSSFRTLSIFLLSVFIEWGNDLI